MRTPLRCKTVLSRHQKKKKLQWSSCNNKPKMNVWYPRNRKVFFFFLFAFPISHSNKIRFPDIYDSHGQSTVRAQYSPRQCKHNITVHLHCSTSIIVQGLVKAPCSMPYCDNSLVRHPYHPHSNHSCLRKA